MKTLITLIVLLITSATEASVTCAGKYDYPRSYYTEAVLTIKELSSRELIEVNLEFKLMPKNEKIFTVTAQDFTSDETSGSVGMKTFNLARGWTDYDLLMPEATGEEFVAFLQQNGHDAGPTVKLVCKKQ